MGLWFSIFPNVQTILAQLAAAVIVVGSYFVAEELKVRRPRRRSPRPPRGHVHRLPGTPAAGPSH
jgi:high-affinity iron transporter